MVLLCQNQDPDDQSTSRKGTEDKLVEEYRKSFYFSQTQRELGELLPSVERNHIWIHLIWGHLLCVSEKMTNDNVRTSAVQSRTITYNTSFLTQFRWVLKRTFRNLLLNPQTSIAQVLKQEKTYLICVWVLVGIPPVPFFFLF